jgi:hypothetical protein
MEQAACERALDGAASERHAGDAVAPGNETVPAQLHQSTL